MPNGPRLRWGRMSLQLRARVSRRLTEAARLGFTRCLMPKSATKKGISVPAGLEVIGARTLRQAMDVALERS